MGAIPQDTRSPFQQLRLIEIKNVGDTEIPPYAAIEVSGVLMPERASELTPGGGRVVIEVRRPTCNSSPRIMFNLMNPVGVGKFGVGTNEFPCWALCEIQTAGKRVGSEEDSYILAEHQDGFMVDGGAYGAGGSTATRIRKPAGESVSFYEGTLYENLCGGSGQADGLQKVGSCCESDSVEGMVELENTYNLRGCANDPFLAIKICSGDEPTYRLVQVKHQTLNTLIEGTYYDDCALKFPKRTLSVMHCCDPVDEDIITMYEHTYMADAKINVVGYSPGTGTVGGIQTCELQLQNSVGRFCAFDPYDPDPLTDIYTPITFSPLQVVVDVVDDTQCVQKVKQWVYLLCWDDEDTPEDVLCLDPCATGTGSGSGSA